MWDLTKVCRSNSKKHNRNQMNRRATIIVSLHWSHPSFLYQVLHPIIPPLSLERFNPRLITSFFFLPDLVDPHTVFFIKYCLLYLFSLCFMGDPIPIFNKKTFTFSGIVNRLCIFWEFQKKYFGNNLDYAL